MKKDFLFVGVQGGLFFGYIFDIILPYNYHPSIRYCGLAIAILGLVILLLAILQLNENLSPFPTPLVHGKLITNGLYHLVRHPIYTGIIIGSLGYGVYSQSISKIAIGFILWILFHFKAKYEEKLLIDKFIEYPNYIKSTGRFFPKVYRKSNK